MVELGVQKREKLPASAFAFPKERKLPLSDASHVRNASERYDQVEGVTTGEKETAKRKIQSAARKHGVNLGKEPD